MTTNIRKRWWVVAPIAVLISASAWTAQGHATTSPPSPPPAPVSKVLAQAVVQPVTVFGHGRTLAGRPWAALLSTYGVSDGYVVDNLFQPGDTITWHSHPGPSLIFVVQGTITNYDSDAPHCAPKDYSAGTTFIDAGGTDVHMLRNNASTVAETIAVQLIPSGQARKTNQDEPANCHV